MSPDLQASEDRDSRSAGNAAQTRKATNGKTTNYSNIPTLNRENAYVICGKRGIRPKQARLYADTKSIKQATKTTRKRATAFGSGFMQIRKRSKVQADKRANTLSRKHVVSPLLVELAPNPRKLVCAHALKHANALRHLGHFFSVGPVEHCRASFAFATVSSQYQHRKPRSFARKQINGSACKNAKRQTCKSIGLIRSPVEPGSVGPNDFATNVQTIRLKNDATTKQG
jgi:hypothetical protein